MEKFVGEYYFLSIEKLIPYQKQARRIFNEEEIQELAQTIKEHGIKSPLLVINSKNHQGSFEVVSGERRLRAAKIVGLTKLPCIIIDDNQAEEVALIENIQRENLHPIELADALAKLLDEKKHGQQIEMAEKIGSDRVRFVKGHIQDLALDLTALDQYLSKNPANSTNAYHDMIAWQAKQRNESPLIADNSVDLVISNCVLNLVSDGEKTQMINEIFRVLKPGGRIAMSDIVSDEYVPDHLKADAELWSGCISGAFQEQEFAEVFIDAGFVGACYDKWESTPWQTVEGIEFRSVTLTASKPLASDGDKTHELIYQGPFAETCDDYGNLFMRGEKTRVDAQSYAALVSGAYQNLFTDCNVQSTDCCAPAANEKSSCC